MLVYLALSYMYSFKRKFLMATLKKGYFITLISPKEVKKVFHKLSIRWRVCLAHVILFLVHPTLINRTRVLSNSWKKNAFNHATFEFQWFIFLVPNYLFMAIFKVIFQWTFFFFFFLEIVWRDNIWAGTRHITKTLTEWLFLIMLPIIVNWT